MRKYIKRIFLALALAGALAATAQPVSAVTPEILKNERDRRERDSFRAWMFLRAFGYPEDLPLPGEAAPPGRGGAPPTPPPQNNDFAADESDGKKVLESLR